MLWWAQTTRWNGPSCTVCSKQVQCSHFGEYLWHDSRFTWHVRNTKPTPGVGETGETLFSCAGIWTIGERSYTLFGSKHAWLAALLTKHHLYMSSSHGMCCVKTWQTSMKQAVVDPLHQLQWYGQDDITVLTFWISTWQAKSSLPLDQTIRNCNGLIGTETACS